MKSLERNSFEEQTRLVPRYVAGDLSRSERAEFEAWLVSSPELAFEVEMERRLRRGIASAARRGWIKRQAPVDRSRERRWQFAIAASAVLSVGIVLSFAIPSGESVTSGKRLFAAAGEQRGASSRNVRLGSVRGSGGVPDVSVSLTDAPSELVIEPDVVVLTCPDGAIELGSAAQTVMGQVMGTPAYMAPEQARGQLNLLSPRTDIFGAGAILYEILAGRPPFVGETTIDVLKQARRGKIEPPSKWWPEVPPALEAICLKALAARPRRSRHREVLVEEVAARDAEVRGPVLDVRGDVGRAHQDQAQVRTLGGDDQLARGFGVLGRADARRLEQRERLLEDAALGERQRDHRHAIRVMRAPRPASRASMRS